MDIRRPLSTEQVPNIFKTFALAFFILLADFVLYQSLGLADVVNLIPTKDTFVSKAQPATSFGGMKVLRTKAETDTARETLLQFNLSSIPSSAQILKGELRLFSKKSKFFKPDNNVGAFANMGSWSESTTWNTRPSRASSFEDSIAVTKTRRYYSWDITNLVQDWVSGVETNFGVRVLGFGGGSLFFKSSEAPSKRPILRVEYTPVSYIGFGDSITRGSKDDITNDNCSKDGRNCGGGYEPILNNRLTNTFGYDHTVLNKGVSGNKSIDGLNRLSSVLSELPRTQYFLILFGTNDALASPPVPSGKGLNPGSPGYAGSFKDNMQQIITAVMEAGKLPYLAKVPYLYAPCGTNEPFPNQDQAPQNLLIQEYNVAIDELVAVNGIEVVPPNFYNYFRAHPEELADFCHPNGLGYKSMARMWRNAIVSAQ